MDGLAVFADRRVGFAAPLADAALAAASRAGVRAVALVDATAASAEPAALATLRRAAGAAVQLLTGTAGAPRQRPSLARVARRHGVPLIVPPERDINHPGLRRRLTDLGATLALSTGCLRIFGPALLQTFAAAVNYHDGALPAYRGLGATAWSVYRGDAESGFTFHYMAERLDAGPILLAGTVPVSRDDTGVAVQRAKTRAAALLMPQVLRLMAGRVPGTPQPPGGEYFSRRRVEALLGIDDPRLLDWADLAARLRAFGRVTLTLAGRRWEVTALEPLENRRGGALAFVTRDGVRARPHRVRHLPRLLYRATRRLAASRRA